jgi:hypothetical protein
MPDQNHNGIPDRIDRVIASILGLLIVVGNGVLQVLDNDPQWLEIVAGVVLPALLTYVALKGRPGAPKAAAMLMAGVLVVSASACSGPYDAAWRTMDGVIRARDMTAQGLAGHARSEHKRCLEKHGAQTPEYAICIKPARKALRHWRQDARPAVDSALQVTAASVQIAEKADMDKPPDYIVLLRPAVCALLRVARLWGHYYPDDGKAVLGYLEAAGKVVCK